MQKAYVYRKFSQKAYHIVGHDIVHSLNIENRLIFAQPRYSANRAWENMWAFLGLVCENLGKFSLKTGKTRHIQLATVSTSEQSRRKQERKVPCKRLVTPQ